MPQIPTIFIKLPTPFTVVICPSGNAYVADQYGLVYQPASADITFLTTIAGGIEFNQRNNTSTTAPTASDDYTEFYGVGSLWAVVTSGGAVVGLYICANPGTSPGTATWSLASTTPIAAQTVTGSAAIGPGVSTVFVNNTSGAAITLTLSSSYLLPSRVTVIDVANNFGSHPCTIAATGGSVRGLSGFAMIIGRGKESFDYDGTNWW